MRVRVRYLPRARACVIARVAGTHGSACPRAWSQCRRARGPRSSSGDPRARPAHVRQGHFRRSARRAPSLPSRRARPFGRSPRGPRDTWRRSLSAPWTTRSSTRRAGTRAQCDPSSQSTGRHSYCPSLPRLPAACDSSGRAAFGPRRDAGVVRKYHRSQTRLRRKNACGEGKGGGGS